MIPSPGGVAMLLDVRLHVLISPVPSFLSTLPYLWDTSSPPLFQDPKPPQHHRIRCSSTKRGSSNWDSNAESVRTGRFRFRDGAEEGRRREKRKWWSDDDGESSQFEEDSEAFDEQLWDTFWIFKVFRSYGWMLPAIIISMLLASGPKAFLMALALPLGQSALSLAIDKVWGSTQDRPKRKSRSRKKPFAGADSNFQNQDDGESSSGGQRWGYKTWVATDDSMTDKGNSQGPSTKTFGGWDELDRHGENDKAPRKQPGRTISRPLKSRPQKGKLSRRLKNSDAPLLLRLLIAIFPFLGSWTKIL